jgi:hypothetical protein
MLSRSMKSKLKKQPSGYPPAAITAQIADCRDLSQFEAVTNRQVDSGP